MSAPIDETALELARSLAAAENHTVIDTAELEALRRDAGRYRWLRHGDNDELVLSKYSYPHPPEEHSHYLPRLQHLDAAIDSAMEAGK